VRVAGDASYRNPISTGRFVPPQSAGEDLLDRVEDCRAYWLKATQDEFRSVQLCSSVLVRMVWFIANEATTTGSKFKPINRAMLRVELTQVFEAIRTIISAYPMSEREKADCFRNLPPVDELLERVARM
jgi:hypothetical protein